MSKHITFRMVAYTDAAGKYKETAFRNGNEDNFYVDDDLSDDLPAHMAHDTPTQLSDCGLLMAVADGMGGMNAGEVASQIAVDTVAEYFAPGRIDSKLAADADARAKYLEAVIRESDRRIKADAATNGEHCGMGSTIIIAWIVGDQLTVSWCGDSRAYRFNPATGLEMLSEDHSYVQELVKHGVLTYEQTFGHPQGNIVTRSLGDPNKAAQPETRQFNVCRGDIVMLCSDGLSGVVRDWPTDDGDNIEDIIRQNYDSLPQCREALWEAARRADWYDNVTAILCKIVDGAPKAAPRPRITATDKPRRTKKQKLLSIVIIVAAVAAISVVGFIFREPIGTAVNRLIVGNDTLAPIAQPVDTLMPTETPTASPAKVDTVKPSPAKRKPSAAPKPTPTVEMPVDTSTQADTIAAQPVETPADTSTQTEPTINPQPVDTTQTL